jgi:hypothetical protein
MTLKLNKLIYHNENMAYLSYFYLTTLYQLCRSYSVEWKNDNELGIGLDVEGSGRDLFKSTIPSVVEWLRKIINTSVGITELLAKSRTGSSRIWSRDVNHRAATLDVCHTDVRDRNAGVQTDISRASSVAFRSVLLFCPFLLSIPFRSPDSSAV